jgi:glycosyltransferase involved in cell wall biosynthesis
MTMRVLQVCPLWYPVKRDAPGGIETFLAQLVSALPDYDCEVTLLASGDSTAGKRILSVVESNIYGQMKNSTVKEYSYYEQQQLLLAMAHADEFDVIHSHIGPAGFALSGVQGWRDKVLHTIHSPVYQDFQWFVQQQPAMRFSVVSKFQAHKLVEHGARHCDVVHNGIETDAFTFNPDGGEGLLFLGRIEREKGPDIAIKVARELGRSLILAGPIVQQDYFDGMIAPLLNKTVRYIGVVDHNEKNKLLGDAGCVLMPSRWDEPFGMVAVEAMACGTPVVVSGQGALPELVDPGVSGFVATDNEMTAKVVHALKLDRAEVRRAAAAQFDISVVAQKYSELYKNMLAS